MPCNAEDTHLFSKIPTPEFYVFYNGTENYPVNQTLKLSDAFITKPEHIPLELTVQVFNINKNKGGAVLSRCKTLDEYSLFVEQVRLQSQLDPENSFMKVVKICIEKGRFLFCVGYICCIVEKNGCVTQIAGKRRDCQQFVIFT